MKKIIAMLCGISLFASTVIAQGKFSVPDISEAEKLSNMTGQWGAMVVLYISYAKSTGKSVDDVAVYAGDQAKVTWDKAVGFEGLVHGMLYHFVSMVPQGKVSILEQTENRVVVNVKDLYPELKESGSIFKVTYGEFQKFWEIAIPRIAEYIGATASFRDAEDGFVVTLEKK
jgi:hypothetical protein